MMDGLKGKTVAVLVENAFEDLELWYPVIRLREAGAEVHTVGTGSAEEYRGYHGLGCRPDKTVEQVRAADYDGVVIPGGWAPDRLRRYPAVLEFVRAVHDGGKPAAAICHGPSVLISAGLLRGRTVTCVAAIRDDVENAGARYVDQAVVVDGRIITSRTPADLPDFCRALIAALSE